MQAGSPPGPQGSQRGAGGNGLCSWLVCLVFLVAVVREICFRVTAACPWTQLSMTRIAVTLLLADCHPYDSVMPDYSGCCFASIPCLLGGPPQNKTTASSLHPHKAVDVAVVQLFLDLLRSRKLTWISKKGPIKTTVLLKGDYRGLHVSLGECMV